VAKKQIKKLKSKKLEDRIAPGMVGGGLVDPGMIDVVDVDSDSSSGDDLAESTDSEAIEAQADAEGEYLDESNDDSSDSTEGDSLEEAQEAEEFKAEENYDEFSNDEPQSDFVEEEPSWQEPDWVTANADGSINVLPPEGVTVDDGVASFPIEVANEEFPMPEDITITESGGLEMPLPEGSEYLAESNQLLIPEGQISLDEVPKDFNAYENEGGSIMVNLPDDGVTVDTEAGTIEFDNHWANEITPENIEISQAGTIDVNLPPEGVEYNDDGSLTFSAEAGEYMNEPAPEYYGEMDYADINSDGSVTIQPPEGISVDGGIAEMDFEAANEHLEMPEEFHLNEDGSASIGLPEGVEYNETTNGLTFPEGEINLDEVPKGIDAHVNPDGSTTVMLQDGLEFNAETNTVEANNYWVNEISPDQMEVSPEGQVNIALPEGTEYFEDGSFTIPSDSVDFMESETPDYVADVEWTNQVDEGYLAQPIEGMELNVQEGELSIPHDMIEEHVPHDDNIEFLEDGTMNYQLPEGVDYNADASALTFPEGSMTLQEFPEQLNAQINVDGTITATLPDGMDYQAEGNQVHLDNYWVNELAPQPIEYTADGEFKVNLPEDTQYNDDGSFVIAEGSADFIENPDPSYVAEGPEWVEANPDGSVTLQAGEFYEAHPDDGQISMQAEYINEGFNDYTPDDVQFNSDGTMDAQVPEGTLYDATSNSLTFPEGSMHMDEIPSELNAELNDNGSISLQLADGMDFNAETQSVHFDNHWTNEITPDNVEFQTDGQVNVDMPHDAHFYDDGSIQIPSESADFMEEPYPEYVDQGPDWVTDNPDGSVQILPPEGIEVNAESGTLTMSSDMAMEQLGGDLIPEDIQLNSDGTMDMKLPEDIEFDYNTDTNSFTLTETPEDFNINEVPEFLEASYDADGNVVVSLPEGVEYNADTGSLNISNEIINEMAPEPIEFTTEGEFIINLPEDTQYFDEGFVISAESADFMDGDHKEHGEYPQGEQETQAS
jgi:hypothetical protein